MSEKQRLERMRQLAAELAELSAKSGIQGEGFDIGDATAFVMVMHGPLARMARDDCESLKRMSQQLSRNWGTA